MERANKEHRDDWYPNYDFDHMIMMQKWTDEELKDLGLDAEKIKAFRAREKEWEETKKA